MFWKLWFSTGTAARSGEWPLYTKWTRWLNQALTLKSNVFKAIPLGFPKELECVHDISSVLALWPAQAVMHASGRSPSSAWCQAPPWPHGPAPLQDGSCAPTALPPLVHFLLEPDCSRICQFSLAQKPCLECAGSPAEVLEPIQSNLAMHVVIGLSRLFCQV